MTEPTEALPVRCGDCGAVIVPVNGWTHKYVINDHIPVLGTLHAAVPASARQRDRAALAVAPQESRPKPHKLWEQARGDSDEYRRLMIEHGWLIPSSGKRVGARICPHCDGAVLAPESLELHIRREHPPGEPMYAPQEPRWPPDEDGIHNWPGGGARVSKDPTGEPTWASDPDGAWVVLYAPRQFYDGLAALREGGARP